MSIALVTMPFDDVLNPSIQLGVVQATLARAGMPSTVHCLNLEFFKASGLSLYDYRQRVIALHHVSVGDWIFRVPQAFDGDCARADADYLYWLSDDHQDLGEDFGAFASRLRAVAVEWLERMADELVATRPRVVGFTVMFSQTTASLALARLLKARDPSIRVVFGGACCDGGMGLGLMRGFPWIDVAVRGESEPVVPGLFRELVDGAPITPRPGLVWRESGELREVPESPSRFSMEEVPQPSYDEYFATLERLGLADVVPEIDLPFETARGCWWGATHHCTFCGLNDETMGFRSSPDDRAYDQLIALSSRYRVTRFAATDNILEMKYLKRLMPRLRDSGFDFNIFFYIKNNLRKRDLRLLFEAGVRRLRPGIESLSTPILKLMDKGQTLLGNIQHLKWCSEIGLQLSWGLLIGFPGEPMEEYAHMARVVPKLRHLQPPSGMYKVQAHRYSPYQEHPERFGIRLSGPVQPLQWIYPSLDEAARAELAYNFKYEHLDGRKPWSYARELKTEVNAWQQAWRGEHRPSLRMWRGPDFLRIVDEREPGAARVTILDATDAALYAACDASATPARLREVLARAGHAVEEADLQSRLKRLTDADLMFEEGGRWLALALPAWDTRREDEQEATEEQRPSAQLLQVRTR